MADDDSKKEGQDPGATTPPPATGAQDAKPVAFDAKNPDKWLAAQSADLQAYIKAKDDEAAKRRHERDEAKTEAAKYQSQLDDAEKARLKKNGEFKELYEKSEQSKEALKQQIKLAEVKLHAQEAGILDTDFVNLIPLEKVTISDTGEIQGAKEAVEAFKTTKPTWFKTAEQTPATPPPPKPTGFSTSPDPTQATEDPTGRDAVMKMSDADFDAFMVKNGYK